MLLLAISLPGLAVALDARGEIIETAKERIAPEVRRLCRRMGRSR